MKKTPRSKATGIYAVPQDKGYPIGDLYHARKAINMSLWPKNRKDRPRVLRAVVKNYPEYNWKEYWAYKRDRAKNKEDIKTYHFEMMR